MASHADPLSGRAIAVGVAGGIAAYKAVELVRLLVKAGAEVHAVMTAHARAFVGELTLQALTGRPVFTDLFNLSQESEIGHIQVADRAALMVIAPATADAIARLSAGRADDALTAVALATRAPLLIAPSMNVNMWENPLTQDNLRRLVDRRGAFVVGPGDGFLACRWTGPGRLAEPADIVEAARRVLTPQDLAGRRIVVTAGPTHEPVDPVRFLGNRSSGKMGWAIARIAARRGATVTLVAGPCALADPPGIEVTRVVTAREMRDAVDRAASGADAVIMAAAVADVRPAAVAERKLKKGGADLGAIALEANPDILAALGARRGDARSPVLIGFAAETGDPVAAATEKLAAKRCDLVVANDVTEPGAGFEVDTNRVTLVDRDGATALPSMSKESVAGELLDRVAALIVTARGRVG